METTETEVQPTPVPEPVLVLTPEAQYYLHETGRWANFLGIIGFIVCALLIIVAIFIGALFSTLAQLSPVYSQMPAGMGVIFSVIIILCDVLYFFFALYLYQFANRIKKGLALLTTDDVTQAFSKLKSFFKLWGIVTIVALCIYALEIIGVVIFGAAMHH